MKLKILSSGTREMVEKAFDHFAASFDIVTFQCNTIMTEDKATIRFTYVVYVLYEEKRDDDPDRPS